MRVVEVARAHRELVGVDGVCDLERPAWRVDAPGVLVDLLPPRRRRVLARRERREVLHVTRELAHEVRAGRPHRHHEIDVVAVRREVADTHTDAIEVCRRLRTGQRVRDRAGVEEVEVLSRRERDDEQ
jgi:hypothetical protein